MNRATIKGITTESTTDATELGREPQSVETVLEELRTTTRRRQQQHDKRGVGETPSGEELKE